MKKQISSFSELQSHFQEREDELIYRYFKLKEEFDFTKKMAVLHEFCDFDTVLTLPTIVPLIISFRTIDFILKNRMQLKRKLTFSELLDVNHMISMVSMFNKQPETFNDLKNDFFKIKPCKNEKIHSTG